MEWDIVVSCQGLSCGQSWMRGQADHLFVGLGCVFSKCTLKCCRNFIWNASRETMYTHNTHTGLMRTCNIPMKNHLWERWWQTTNCKIFLFFFCICETGQLKTIKSNWVGCITFVFCAKAMLLRETRVITVQLVWGWRAKYRGLLVWHYLQLNRTTDTSVQKW